MATTLTWLGHSAFRLDTTAGIRVYVDPFLTGNPKCPDSEREPERCDLVVLTHGHGDHVGDSVTIAKRFECPVVAPVELRDWLTAAHGLPEDDAQAMNKGGTESFAGVRVTLTDANHSSSNWQDGRIVYTGEPTGIVVGQDDGPTVYFAGDTNVFGDMALIRRLYSPDVAVLPIGDHFTMGPAEAAVAAELLGAARVVPCHYGTFGLLTGTPDALRPLLPDGVELLVPEPGETLEALMRERWFGATGRRVPEIALEDSLDLDGALVLDAVDDDEALRAAHAEGRPVVVRAADAAGVAQALARPEVACALVTDPALLRLDLSELTYG